MKRMTIAGIGVLALLAVAACGTADAAGPSEPTSQQIQAEALYLDLNRSIFGTSVDRLMAEELLNYRQQTRIAECMKGYGFDYQPIPYTAGSAREVNPGDSTAFAPIVADFGWGAQKLAAAEATAGTDSSSYEALTDTAKHEWADAMNAECTQKGFASGGDPYPGTGDGKLANTFHLFIEELNNADSVQARLPDYIDCMKTAGYDVTLATPGYDGTEPWASLQGQVIAKYPANAPVDPATDHDWRQAANYETAAATSDSTCRTTLHYETLGAVASQLTEFKAAHATEITALAGEWDALRTEHHNAGL